MKGVILAGGTALRLSPLIKVNNKHFLPGYNEQMVYKVIKSLSNSGISEIIIVLGGKSMGNSIRFLRDGIDFSANIAYIYQQEAESNGEALFLTKEIVEGPKVVVIFGDSFTDEII